MAEREVTLRFRVSESGFDVFDKAGTKLDHVQYAAKTAQEAVTRLNEKLKYAEGSFPGTLAAIEKLRAGPANLNQALGAQAAGAIGAGLQNLNGVIKQQSEQAIGAVVTAEAAAVGAASHISAAWSAAGIAVGATLTGAGYAIARVAGEAVTAAAEQEKATAALNAQLQIQGRYSGEYSRALQEQATALQHVTTFADETINSAQTLLATFPKLGNDVIPRATQATLDLATALGTDLNTAAQTIGIALNDPAEGLLRLSRLGVRFTEDQKAVIQSLVDSGKAAEAQTFILDELAARMGGRAQAAALTYDGSIAQLHNSFGELLEEVGNFVVKNEAVRQGFTDLKDNVDAATAAVRQYREQNEATIQQDTAGWLTLVSTAYGAIKDNLVTANPLLQENVGIFNALGRAIAAVGAQFQSIKEGGGFLDDIRELNGRIADANSRTDLNAAGRAYRDYLYSLLGYRARRPGDRFAGPPEPFAPGEFSTASGDQSLESAFGGPFGLPPQPPAPYGGFNPATVRTGGYDYLQNPVGPFLPNDPNNPANQQRGGAGASDARRAERDAQKAQADLEKRTAESLADEEKVRLALLDAQVSMRERAIKLGEDDLRLAQQAGASQEDQLRIAGQLDTLEKQRLIAVQARIQAELDGLLQFGPTINPEVIKLQDELVGVNEELARGPQHAADLTRELQRSRDVAIDLGQSLNDSLQRAVDGFLNSGGKGLNFGDLLTNTLRAQASTIIGGLGQSFLNGGEFKIEGLDKLTGAFDRVGNWFSRLFGGGGVPSSISGGATPAAGTFADVTGGSSSTAAAPSGGQSGGGSAGLGIGLAAASYGASVALDIALNAHDRVNSLFSSTNTLRSTLTRGDIASAAGGGGIIGGIGKTILENFNGLRGGLVGGALASFDPISALIAGSSLFNAPTAGTQRIMGLENVYKRAFLPQQRDYSYGGHSGLRAQFLNVGTAAQEQAFGAVGFGSDQEGLQQPTLEQLSTPGRNGATYAKNPLLVQGLIGDLARASAARPDVAGLASNEGLGLGVALTGTARGGRTVATDLTNNLLLLGVSADEARRQMLKVAHTAGIDLISGLESVNKAYLEHKLTQQQLATSAAGLVKLFNDDLPKAIDVEKIIAERTSATGGVDVAATTAGIRGAVDAYQIRQQIAESRLQGLDPRLQGQEIKRRIGALDTELQDQTLTYAQREDILQRRAALGFQYVQYADQRFTGQARRRAEEYGYTVAEDTAKQLEDLGKITQDSTQANTDATTTNNKKLDENTLGLNNLAKAIANGIQGKVKLDVTGLGEDEATTTAMIRRIVKDVLTSPEFRASQRESV